MRILWLVPIALIVVGAGAWLRRRRNRGEVSITPDPVSGQWLAEARGREEHPW
jgi:cytochrome c-type biogenesis protein CcmH/NrfF